MACLASDYYASIRPHLRYPALASQPEESNIYVFETTPKETVYSFTNSEIFETHIATTPKPEARIVSICCQNSLRPLGITEQAMRKLMSLYNIDSSFFDLVVSFGDKPRSSDAGHGGMSVKQGDNGAYGIPPLVRLGYVSRANFADMQYLFTYAEDDSKGRETVSWRIRQVCVFHRYDPLKSGNLWILLHASPQSKLQRQIEQTLSTSPAALLAEWSSIHLLVLSTYLGGWRWCIRNLGDEIEKTVDIALTLDLSKPRTGDHKDGLVYLLKQQYLGDRLVPVASRVGVALTTLHRLEQINSFFHSKRFSSDDEFQSVASELTYYITSLEGHLESVNVLERKVRGISDLLAVALTVENQAVTIDINNKMLDLNNKLVKLTNKSLDENATVRIVTLVTLIYLPASFVSVGAQTYQIICIHPL
ncbi:hypothetical protein Asppvi_005889 [Aspergillus pseudoviridinutans]|uniref:CorA-like transporter domain-containing protein n=1 Tax=Aspergillus pseudoviridinutans TaxID=1517512 RepID=A0A9P3BA24_9EURO|nr:uncharacterized protein Asppvi_005889 [Aspergillus pseudoviridinutans]GIJ86990.1 hypothetical protein Asppvi_005889 [Aspergillus pseudoviridinutans]